MLVGGLVHDCRRIENGDVRKIPWLKQAIAVVLLEILVYGAGNQDSGCAACLEALNGYSYRVERTRRKRRLSRISDLFLRPPQSQHIDDRPPSR